MGSVSGDGDVSVSRIVNHHYHHHHWEQTVNVCVCVCLCVQKALELMSLVPKRCNDMMNLGRLQGYEVHLCLGFKVGIKDSINKIRQSLT